jgi:hypothetical protein
VRANTRNLSLNGNRAFITWNVPIPALNTHTHSYHRIRHTNFTVFGSYNYIPNISWLLVIILLPNTGHTWYQQSTRTLYVPYTLTQIPKVLNIMIHHLE